MQKSSSAFTAQDKVCINPSNPLRGALTPPSSKYHTLRYTLAACLASGTSIIHSPAISDDTEVLLRACAQLGADIQRVEAALTIRGTNGLLHVPPGGIIDVGNAGAVLRLLMGICAVLPEPVTFVTPYSESLGRRPNADLLAALKQIGVVVENNTVDGTLPLTVDGRVARGGKVQVSGKKSSQYVSSLLFLAPLLAEGLDIEIVDGLASASFVDLTIDILRETGIVVIEEEHHRHYIVPGAQTYRPGEYRIPGDYSSAAALLAATAVTRGEIILTNLPPGDIGGETILKAFAEMGMEITRSGTTIHARADGPLRGITFDGNTAIDSVPVIAAAACFAETPSNIYNVAHLRLKESDRINDLATELNKAGCHLIPSADAIEIHPAGSHAIAGGVTLHAHADHRLIEACAIVGLGSQQPITIAESLHIAKSYPGFFDDLVSMGAIIDNMQRLFLVGLSGSGKTTVGQEAARLLGWKYIDTDELLAGRCGMTVGQTLVEYGEARFRKLETEALATAAEQERVVIATGGGAVIAEANRILMQERGLMIYLRAPTETAWKRVQEQMRAGGEEAVRPLLAGNDGLQRLQTLFAARRQRYEAAPVQIETGDVLSDYAAKQVVAVAIARGYVSGQSAGVSYSREEAQVIVEWGALHRLPQALQKARFRRRVFIVTDSGIGGLFAEPVQALLEGAGMEPHIFTIPAGEASKSFECWRQILDWLVDLHVERREPVVALGGGVVGDLTGFAASCYLRGVPLVQVPMSLLAQVDSATGGKTGINHPRGKNLVGAFYQPRLVLVDPAVLLTLPERAYREGWGEIVKYGMILDAGLFQLLETHVSALLARDPALLTRVIARCIDLKLEVVQSDERDSGLRNILNYGHTFGHALEAISGFSGAETWLHGEAVSLGMEVAARIAVNRGLLAREDALRQRALLQAIGLPISCAPIDIDAALKTMLRDKKVQDGRTRWILPDRIGHVAMYNDVDVALMRDAIAGVCGGEETIR